MPPPSQPPLAPTTIPLAGTLLLTASAIHFLCPLPRPQSLTWTFLLALTLLYLLITAASHILAIRLTNRLFRPFIDRPTNLLTALTWPPTVWLLPCLLLARGHSPWIALFPPLIAAHSILFLKRNTPPTPTPPTTPGPLFQPTPAPPFAETTLPPTLASLGLHFALIYLLAADPYTASLFLALSVAIAILLYPLPPKPHPRLTLPTLAAALITLLALTPSIRTPVGGDVASLLQMAPNETPTHTGHSANSPAFDYTGIILRPPSRPHPRVIPPPPIHPSQTSSALANPVVIPFDGAYWYFKQPDLRPRPNARTTQGDPLKANIRSTDFLPLQMEARQLLDHPVLFACCSAIRLDLRNADTRDGAIAIELVLLRPTPSGPASLSLGTQTLPSSTVHPIPLTRPPVDESLTFPIPPQPPGNEFNEIAVVIKTARERSRAGAQIAVRQFVLLP